MELSPKDKDRLKKALLVGSALVAVDATVYYIRDPEGSAKGYIYRLNKGKDWLLGGYRDGEKTEIIQISGTIGDDLTMELEEPKINPEDIPILEEVINIAMAQGSDSN